MDRKELENAVCVGMLKAMSVVVAIGVLGYLALAYAHSVN